MKRRERKALGVLAREERGSNITTLYHPPPKQTNTKKPQLFSLSVSACAVGRHRPQIFKEQLIPQLFLEIFFYRKAVVW